jgi:pSer/pThr/pTyr-binding forkhead associated (FHA) protein
MSDVQQSTFKIIREDRAVDAKTIRSDGLRIGRLPDSDIWLNHPKVSRLHAGINQIEGYFYLINLSASSGTTLNGRVIPFNEAAALTAGDEFQIGPFFLSVAEADETLTIRVVLEFALNVGERESFHKSEKYKAQVESRQSGALKIPTGPLDTPVGEEPSTAGTGLSEILNALKLFWGKRTREKAGRKSPLHPQTPPRPGKFQFNWTPTRDLVRPWPFAIFIWAALVVAALSTLAAFAHKTAFAPYEPISKPHMRTTVALTPPIAKRPNGDSCMSCHPIGVSAENRQKMNAKCADCHQTEAFVASIIPAHRVAGLTCTSCHIEHRGENFRPLNAALESCAKCHNDRNKNLYNGKSVHTPHGGTFGYPVVNATWIWKGLDAEELTQKTEVLAFLKKNRVDSNQTQEWVSAQFHGIHLAHVRVVQSVDGITDEDGATVLSCSSCHKTGYMGKNVDRTFPRTTCGHCHNAAVFNEPTSSLTKAETPSCTSCHVQHVKDTHWTSAFRETSAGGK